MPTSWKEPTARQLQVLRTIAQWRRTMGSWPTRTELGLLLRITTVTAHLHVQALAAAGCVAVVRYQPRGIRLTLRGWGKARARITTIPGKNRLRRRT